MIKGHCYKNNEAHVRIFLSGVISPAADLIITNASMLEETFIDTDCLAYYQNVRSEKPLYRLTTTTLINLKDKETNI